MRTLLLATLIACNSSQATTPARTERNLVCERVAIVQAEANTPRDKLAKCEPEYPGVGELFTYTARVTPHGGKTVVCGLNAGQLSMACGTLEVQAVKQEAPAVETGQPANPAPMKPTKAGKKK